MIVLMVICVVVALACMWWMVFVFGEAVR